MDFYYLQIHKYTMYYGIKFSLFILYSHNTKYLQYKEFIQWHVFKLLYG